MTKPIKAFEDLPKGLQKELERISALRTRELAWHSMAKTIHQIAQEAYVQGLSDMAQAVLTQEKCQAIAARKLIDKHV